MPKIRYGVVIAAVAVLAGVGVIRFAGSEAATDRADLAAATGSPGDPSGTAVADQPVAASANAPAISLETDPAGAVPSDRPLVVRLANGTLTAVTVEDGQGQPLAGELGADGVTWQSSEPPVPQTAYTVRVTTARRRPAICASRPSR